MHNISWVSLNLLWAGPLKDKCCKQSAQPSSLKTLIRQNGVFDKLLLVTHMIFLIIQENEAENMYDARNVYMMLDKLFLAFQINFHHHKYFHELLIFTFSNWMTNVLFVIIQYMTILYDLRVYLFQQ